MKVSIDNSSRWDGVSRREHEIKIAREEFHTEDPPKNLWNACDKVV